MTTAEIVFRARTRIQGMVNVWFRVRVRAMSMARVGISARNLVGLRVWSYGYDKGLTFIKFRAMVVLVFGLFLGIRLD